MDSIKTALALFTWLQAQLAMAGPRRPASACYGSVLSYVSAWIASHSYVLGMNHYEWDSMLRTLKSPTGCHVTQAEEHFAHFAMGKLAALGGPMTTNDANIAMIKILGWADLFAVEGEPGQRHLVSRDPRKLGMGVRVRVAESIALA